MSHAGLPLWRVPADQKDVSPNSDPTRLRALDGLRGIAALVVVLSHVVLASVGGLSTAYALNTQAPGLERWLLRSPLAIWWAGQEAVMVFFVLSGFVLTRMLLRTDLPWSVFYVRRGLRIYLPAWMSLVLAGVLAAAVQHQHLVTGVQFWLDSVTPQASLSEAARAGVLVLPGGGGVNPNAVLWSLRWEVLFFIALPVVLLAAAPLRRLAAPLAALGLIVAPWSSSTVMYLLPFLFGLCLALHEPAIVELRERLAGRGAARLLMAAAVLLTADLWLPGAQLAGGTGGTLVIAGAVLTVASPLIYRSVASALERRALQWLGSRSYSLYLVHLPIVVAYAHALHGPGFMMLLGTAMPSAMVVAEAFYRLVERPSHRLARRVRQGPAAPVVAAAELHPA